MNLKTRLGRLEQKAMRRANPEEEIGLALAPPPPKSFEEWERWYTEGSAFREMLDAGLVCPNVSFIIGHSEPQTPTQWELETWDIPRWKEAIKNRDYEGLAGYIRPDD